MGLNDFIGIVNYLLFNPPFWVIHIWCKIVLEFFLDPIKISNLLKDSQTPPPYPSQIIYGWPNSTSKTPFSCIFLRFLFLCSKFFNQKEHILLYHKKKNSRTFDYPR